MKYFILAIALIWILSTAGCKTEDYINESDAINNKDEILIKQFRSHHNYTNDELEKLKIEYLGEVDNFRIYYVPYKGSSGELNPKDWIVEGYVFPPETRTRIIGVKKNNLFVLGKLIHETNININDLYEVMPIEFKIIEND